MESVWKNSNSFALGTTLSFLKQMNLNFSTLIPKYSLFRIGIIGALLSIHFGQFHFLNESTPISALYVSLRSRNILTDPRFLLTPLEILCCIFPIIRVKP